MAPGGQPAFGRRAGVSRAAPAPKPDIRPLPVADLELSAEAEAFAHGLRAAGRRPDPQSAELADWKRAHRARLWKAAGIWKYLAGLCGMLSAVVNLHDFGPLAGTAASILNVAGLAFGAIAFWRARARG